MELVYNDYRDYNFSLGRYVQFDPIGLRGGVNPYGYVQSNPVRFFDISGTTDPTRSIRDIIKDPANEKESMRQLQENYDKVNNLYGNVEDSNAFADQLTDANKANQNQISRALDTASRVCVNAFIKAGQTWRDIAKKFD
jgi:uncharacterized protein RhaS with RHS repeats